MGVMKMKQAIDIVHSTMHIGGFGGKVLVAREMAIDAMYKQQSKKVVLKLEPYKLIVDHVRKKYVCPTCKKELSIHNQTKYCANCGQKLDWKGVDK